MEFMWVLVGCIVPDGGSVATAEVCLLSVGAPPPGPSLPQASGLAKWSVCLLLCLCPVHLDF